MVWEGSESALHPMDDRANCAYGLSVEQANALRAYCSFSIEILLGQGAKTGYQTTTSSSMSKYVI